MSQHRKHSLLPFEHLKILGEFLCLNIASLTETANLKSKVTPVKVSFKGFSENISNENQVNSLIFRGPVNELMTKILKISLA
jgi:hypothetical protein